MDTWTDGATGNLAAKISFRFDTFESVADASYNEFNYRIEAGRRIHRANEEVTLIFEAHPIQGTNLDPPIQALGRPLGDRFVDVDSSLGAEIATLQPRINAAVAERKRIAYQEIRVSALEKFVATPGINSDAIWGEATTLYPDLQPMFVRTGYGSAEAKSTAIIKALQGRLRADRAKLDADTAALEAECAEFRRIFRSARGITLNNGVTYH